MSNSVSNEVDVVQMTQNISVQFIDFVCVFEQSYSKTDE